MFRSRIIGTGAFAPSRVVTNDEMAKIVDTNDEWIRTRSGIRERRLIDYHGHMTTSELAEPAARKALEAAGVTPEQLDMIIVGTVTPDLRCPSAAVFLQQKLGAKNASAFDVGAACAGSMYALTVADQFIRTGHAKKVLVVGAEALSTITNWKDRSTCVLFGDAAGAFVVEGGPEDGPGLLDTAIYADGTQAMLIHIPAGGSKQRLTPALLEQEGDKLIMNGREVYKFAVPKFAEIIREAVSACHLTLNDIKLFIPHQMNARMIEAVAQRLEFPMERVFMNIERYGNTSAASIPIALDEAIRVGRIQRGDILLFSAMGAGLTWGTMVIRW